MRMSSNLISFRLILVTIRYYSKVTLIYDQQKISPFCQQQKTSEWVLESKTGKEGNNSKGLY